MNVRQQLVGRMHDEDVRRLALLTDGGEGTAFTAVLYGLLWDEDARVAANAAWVLTRAKRPGRQFLQQKQPELVDAALSASGSTMRRLLLTLLLKQPFEADGIRTDLLDFCLAGITDTRQPVAVRALCVYLAGKLCAPFEELQGELAMTLGMLEGGTLTPGLRHACRAVMAEIEKR